MKPFVQQIPPPPPPLLPKKVKTAMATRYLRCLVSDQFESVEQVAELTEGEVRQAKPGVPAQMR